MDYVIGLIGWALIIWAVLAWRHRSKMSRVVGPARTAGPRTPTTRSQSRQPGTQLDATDVGAPIAGWLLGHGIAHGHDGFPGDPLPGGHLGSPADLAFWGSVFDDDPDEEQ